MTRQLRANQRIDPFVFSRRPEVSTLTTAGVKYSSPWPSVKRVLSLAAVYLAKRDEQGGEGGEGGCENSRWKTSRPFLRLGAVVAGGPAAGGLASSWLCGLQHTDFWLTLPSFTASLLFKLLFNVCFFFLSLSFYSCLSMISAIYTAAATKLALCFFGRGFQFAL